MHGAKKKQRSRLIVLGAVAVAVAVKRAHDRKRRVLKTDNAHVLRLGPTVIYKPPTGEGEVVYDDTTTWYNGGCPGNGEAKLTKAQNADWTSCLDNNNHWCNVPHNGLVRGLRRSGGKNRLHNLEGAEGMRTENEADMECGQVGAFQGGAGWSFCPAGYYVAGFHRGGGDNIEHLNHFKCCRHAGWEKEHRNCEIADWRGSFDHDGTVKCPNNKYLMGLWRFSCNHLSCIEVGMCCDLPCLPASDCKGEFVQTSKCNCKEGQREEVLTYKITSPGANGGASCPHEDGAVEKKDCGCGPTHCQGEWKETQACNCEELVRKRKEKYSISVEAAFGGKECPAKQDEEREEDCGCGPDVDCVGKWEWAQMCSCPEVTEGRRVYRIETEAKMAGRKCREEAGAEKPMPCHCDKRTTTTSTTTTVEATTEAATEAATEAPAAPALEGKGPPAGSWAAAALLVGFLAL